MYAFVRVFVYHEDIGAKHVLVSPKPLRQGLIGVCVRSYVCVRVRGVVCVSVYVCGSA